jgi:diguanylate cyclase
MATKQHAKEFSETDAKAEISAWIKDAVAKAERTKQRVSVAYLDIDCFKKLNDEIGQEKGDQILRDFAGILKKNTRSSDRIGRFGGDAHVIVMPNTEKEEALILLEDTRRMIAERVFKVGVGSKDARTLKITFSGGVAAFPYDGKDEVTVLRSADNALMSAKVGGRNRICLAVEEKMVLKSNYYTRGQLERLAKVAAERDLTEAFLLREALDDVLQKYVRAERGVANSPRK